jgi:hypothetical protein
VDFWVFADVNQRIGIEQHEVRNLARLDRAQVPSLRGSGLARASPSAAPQREAPRLAYRFEMRDVATRMTRPRRSWGSDGAAVCEREPSGGRVRPTA